MAYRDEGFNGVILYGVREEINKHDLSCSTLVRYPVATFTSERHAQDYVKSAELVSPQGGGDRPRIAYKKNTVLVGCTSCMIGPKPRVDSLPENPTPLEIKEVIKEPPAAVKPKRKRRTKAEMEETRRQAGNAPEQPKQRRKRRTKAEMEAARAAGEA